MANCLCLDSVDNQWPASQGGWVPDYVQYYSLETFDKYLLKKKGRSK